MSFLPVSYTHLDVYKRQTLLSINPFYTGIVCIIPRVLMGLLCGWIFRGLARIDKTKIVSYVVAGLSGALLNTIFFMSSLILLFGRTDYILEIWNTIAPVSYTHLDVYKRQEQVRKRPTLGPRN